MGISCDYLQSEEWANRLAEIETRIFDIETLIWGCDEINDTEKVVRSIVEDTPLDRKQLRDMEPEAALRKIPSDILSWDTEDVSDIKAEILNVPDECPHDTYEDADRCLFHLSEGERTRRGVSDEQVQDEFKEVVSGSDRERKEFTGATFSDLNLELAEIGTDDNYPIRLIGAEIETLDLNRTVVDQPVFLSGASIGRGYFKDAEFNKDCEFWGVQFENDADFTYTTFHGDTEFWSAEFNGPVSFYASKFDTYAEFRNVTFCDDSQFKYLNVDKDLEMWGSDFHGEFCIESAKVGGSAEFRYTTFYSPALFDSIDVRSFIEFARAEFRSSVSFERTRIRKKSKFWATTFHEDISFRGSKFDGYLEFSWGTTIPSAKGQVDGAVFHGEAVFSYCEFSRDVEFWNVLFEKPARFDHTVFRGTTEFLYSRFEDTASFESTVHSYIDFTGVESVQEVKLVDSKIPDGVITQPTHGETYYDFSHSKLGDVELTAETDRNVFDYFKFYETEFDSFNFPEHRPSLNKSWDIHQFGPESESQHGPEVLESTYLKAKNGASQVGDTTAASEFFVRELKYSRQSHWTNFTDSDRGVKKRAVSLYKWASNSLFNVTCGYGEKPFRTVTFSLVIIVTFAFMYMSAGIRLQGNSGFITHIIFSLQTFVTLLFGTQTPEEQIVTVRFLTSLQAFIGGFMIALFVFALTRSVDR